MSKFFRAFSIASCVAAAGLCGSAFAQDVFPYTDGGDEGSGPGGGDWVEAALIAPMFVISEVSPIGTGLESYCTAISSNGWIAGGAKTASSSSSPVHAFRVRADGGPVQDLGSLPGLTHSGAYGINDSGDVVGVASAASNLYGTTAQPWVYRNGVFTNLDPLQRGVYASANAINRSGWVVGTNSFLGTGSVESFKWQTGLPINLPDLAGDTCHISYGMGINDAANVVGYSAAPGQCGDNRPVRYGSSGGVWDLGTLGGANGQAQAINNLNEIVGYSETAGGANRATRWSNGVITNLGTLGGASFALATNDYSDAVGYYIDTFNQQRAAAWINGTLYDLNSIVQNRAGWRLLIATGINNSGQIVGQARNPAGKLRGFLLTPPCRSDFNGDGGIDGNDVTSFFISWENSMADADVNRDGGVDGGDIQVFFELWEAGRC